MQKQDVRFFALDSNYMDKDHHPLYSSGATHGSEVDLRAIIEPMFVKDQ